MESTPTSPKSKAAWARQTLVAGAKLGLCGATIFAIGWAFLTFGPEGEVQESQADIANLAMFSSPTSTQRFVKALDSLGHEKPRIYNYNGTQVYFSTRASSKRPRDLITEYQQAFVEEGVNERVYDVRVDMEKLAKQGKEAVKAESDARIHAMLDGEVQVLYHDDERVIMGSAILDLKNAPPENVIGEDGEPVTQFDFAKIFQAHRYIEATWHPVRQESIITASWGDEDFDITKTFPQAMQEPSLDHEGMAADLVVPTCLGCERLTRFATEAHDKPYVLQIFKSSQSPEQVAAFYRAAMSNRGWQESDHSERLEKYSDQLAQEVEGGTVLQFKRDKDNLTLTIHPDDQGASVTATLTD